MIRETEMIIFKTSMSVCEMQERLGNNNIAFVVDDEENYVGCYTKVKGINTDSKVIIQCEEEKQLAKSIFAENERIHNIPVIDEEGKLLYQYVKDFEDYDFKSKSYWEKRYSNGGTSGAGSYNHLAEFKAEVINQFIERNKINSIIEWGCGDGNQLGLFLPISYTGYDVSNTAVELCRKKYAEDVSKKFYLYDGSRQQVEKADLTLSLDVIFHLIEDDVFEDYMYNVFTNSAKYVCIYSNDYEQRMALHVKGRKFTEYVERVFPEWELVECVKNKYPYDAADPNNTSFCDFFFYKKAGMIE
ncbi:MAG: hypothetical protein K2N85_02670 [Lachnospiraceae bacterium]|nr:hypothetical protein [Lachnospiraceae bacterium]